MYGKSPGCPKPNALRTGAENIAPHNQQSRNGIFASAQQDDADRPRDCDEGQLTEALRQQEAQVQVIQEKAGTDAVASAQVDQPVVSQPDDQPNERKFDSDSHQA